MKKIGLIILTLTMTVFAYIIMTLLQPTIVDISNTANMTMAASSNMTNYPGASEVMVGAPLWLYFVPGVLCIVIVVKILKS